MDVLEESVVETEVDMKSEETAVAPKPAGAVVSSTVATETKINTQFKENPADRSYEDDIYAVLRHRELVHSSHRYLFWMNANRPASMLL